MKVHLPLSLLASLLAVLTPQNVSASVANGNLGNVMFVGDSITHGINTASYRWALHKIFADNGIAYNAEGVITGNSSGGVAAGTSYGGRVFNNMHSSQASARAWEIAGRRPGSRFSGSNIKNWLGLTDKKADGSAYTGSTFTGENTPDTFFMMIGTNDLLSDNGDNLPGKLATVTATLLGDMDTIVGAMRQANPNASVFINTIPCWTIHSNSNNAATHQAVATYNESLKNWANKKEGVTIVDMNAGMLDVASTIPFYGVASMFRQAGTDGLHPNAQGDLLMAGNLAKAMGYAGRTAGQERKAAGDLGVNFGHTPVITTEALTAKGFTSNNVTVANNRINFNNPGSSTLTYAWDAAQDHSKGYTVDFTLTMGNGSTGGWNTTDQFSLSLGNGTLNINEAYIQWGTKILYSTDMSANTAAIRVSYVAGDAANGLKAGYYIWLGDVLIGEAETAAGASSSGINFSYSGSLNAYLSNLTLDGALSYAPSSNGITGPLDRYLVQRKDASAGMISWTTETAVSAVATGNAYNARNATNSNIIHLTATGSVKNIYGNSGAYGTADSRQNIWLTLGEGIKSDAGWIGGHTSGDLFGDVNMRFVDGSIGKSTVFGTVNGGTVHGNIYVEFSSNTGNFDTSFTTQGGGHTSVVGSYQTNVEGNISFIFNDGSFTHNIYGGIHMGAKTISGSTNLYLNGSTFLANIYAGNFSAGTINGGTNLTVTGTDTVLGKANGDNWVWGNIYGGNNTGGTVNGGTTVTLQDIAASTGTGSDHKFDKFAGIIDGKGGGTVNGEKKLIFSNYQTTFLGTLQNFDKITVSNNSNLVLDKVLGDTVKALTNEAGSTLRFTQNQGATLDITNNGTINITGGLTLKSADAGTGLYEVEGGTLDLANQTVGGKVSISAGSLANTSGLGAKSVSISNLTGNVNLGGMDGSKLGAVNMGVNSGTISGLTGNADLSGSLTDVRLSSANMGADGTGVILFDTPATSTLTVGELTLTLTADAVALLNKPGAYSFHVTNGTLNGDTNKITLSEYNGMAWDITRTEGGKVIITFGAMDHLVINTGETKTITASANLTGTPSVTNNGTLHINLTGADTAATINYLAGTESKAVVNTGNRNDVILTLDNKTADDPDKTGNTAYAGSIEGAAQLVKNGEMRLTVDGHITASALDIQQGELSLKGKDSVISGTLNVADNATLTLSGTASLSATDLTGSGNISMQQGSILSITRDTLSDLTLNASITGAGTLKLSNCNLILGTDNTLGEDILLHLNGGSLQLHNNSTLALEGLHQETASSTLALGNNGNLELAANAGRTYSYKGDITGTGSILHRGEGTQIILSDGNAAVDISITQPGGSLVLGSKDPSAASSITYEDISIGSNAPTTLDTEAKQTEATADLSILNNTTAQTLSIAGNGKLYMGGNPNQNAVRLTLEGNNNGVAAEFGSGASLDITVDKNGIDQPWSYITAENGSVLASGADASINVNLFGLGTIGDWGILPEFSVNVIYAENGLVLDNGDTWTTDTVDLSYAGFANIVYDITKSISADGKQFEVHFVKLGDSPLKAYASTANQQGAADSLWKIAGTPANMTEAMANFANTLGTAEGAGNGQAVSAALSSFAGSGITALQAAQKGSLQDQVLSLRNRVTQMGTNNAFINEDLPYLNAWIEGNGGYKQLDDDMDESGYRLNSWGGSAGFDVTCNDAFVWGMAFTASYGDLNALSSKGDLDSYYGNLFARYQSKRWAHNFILTYGWNDASLTRHVNGAAGDFYSQHSSTNGCSYGAFYEGTYDLYLNENRTSVFQPMLNASIYKSQMDGFNETGDLPMQVKDMDATYGTVGLGMRLRGVLGDNIVGRNVMGEIRAQVVQDLGDRRATADVTPAGFPGAGFRVRGAEAGSTGIQIGAGISIPTGNSGSVFADVNGEFRNKMNSVNGSIGYRFSF